MNRLHSFARLTLCLGALMLGGCGDKAATSSGSDECLDNAGCQGMQACVESSCVTVSGTVIIVLVTTGAP